MWSAQNVVADGFKGESVKYLIVQRQQDEECVFNVELYVFYMS